MEPRHRRPSGSAGSAGGPRAAPAASPAEPTLDLAALTPRLRAALDEDLGAGDITTLALIPERATATADLVARQAGVVCGLPLVEPILHLAAEKGSDPFTSEGLTPFPQFVPVVAEGLRVAAGTVLGRVSGPLRAILAAERTMLNFLQRLSGIATLTAHYVAAVEGTGAVIVDTRKTTPLWRDLEKYAVRVGGGKNHRMGLYDAVLIKDNHIDGGNLSLAEAIRRAHQAAPQATFVEIEGRSLDQLRDALPAEPDIVMPDNFTLDQLREAVAMVHEFRGGRGRPLVEASGGITLKNVRAVAETGVDRIAVGALTHSAPALDIALEVAKI